MSTRRRATLAAAASAFVLILAACGGDDGRSADTTSAPAATIQAGAATTDAGPTASDAASTDPSEAASTASSGSGGGLGKCDKAVVEVGKTLSGDTRIVKIGTDGSCAVNIFTSLAATSDTVSDALDLCDAASVVAYANDATGVVIYAVGNKEQAIGVKETQCIGEP